jgi:LDH2 family malate/lactate/ureidoglycolate dehydrogenase
LSALPNPIGRSIHSGSRDVLVSADTIEEQASLVLQAWGMPEDDIPIALKMILYADLRGIDSHGIGMFPTYEIWRKKGWINFQPDIEVVRENEVSALVDADGALGHLPSHRAMNLAIDKCKKLGIGAVSVRNSSHFGAAGVYASMAVEENLIGLATTSAPTPAIVPTFGLEPRLGTNPVAFAAPARRNRSFLLDMATSTVAIGKITLALRHGRKLPKGWVQDERGRPLTDARAASRSHRMTPLGYHRELGSHKGYGLAAMVEILTTILSGRDGEESNVEDDSSRKRRVSHFFLALDPGLYRDAEGFAEGMDELIDSLHACTPSDPGRSVLVAGDPEYTELARRRVEGIPLSLALVERMREVARHADVPFLLERHSD